MDFTFFMTHYTKINDTMPVVIGYENYSRRKVEFLEQYKGKQFIHSGNWWGIDPKKRTREKVLENQEKMFFRGKTIGFMSLNTPASLTREDYWNLSEKIRVKAINKCLENANWALEHIKVNTKIYCSLEVTSYKESVEWFKKAKEQAHNAFCRGIAEFLRQPKFRKDGLKKIMEITIGARKVLENFPFHLSGTGSLYLMPILAYLGATSLDGSTPITSALARGTIYDKNGKGFKVRSLKSWKCNCNVCKNFDEKKMINLFNENNHYRVLHNIEMWRNEIQNIKDCKDRSELKEYIENSVKTKKSNYFKRTWEMAKEMLKKFN
ncbi:MAG: hypothetical protein ACTSRG_13530 [Candidatus Helarchaeota archaeon]